MCQPPSVTLNRSGRVHTWPSRPTKNLTKFQSKEPGRAAFRKSKMPLLACASSAVRVG